MLKSLLNLVGCVLSDAIKFGAIFVILCQVANADQTIDDRPERYRSAEYKDPMMPHGWRSKDDANPDLSKWKVSGAIINQYKRQIMIDGQLFSMGESYQNHTIMLVEIGQITVVSSTGKVSVLSIQ